MSLRYSATWEGGLSPEKVMLLDDNGFSIGEGPWTDLLAGQTTIRVEWSKNGGATWGGTNVDLTDDGRGRNYLAWNPPAAIADGTEILVRFVIRGVTYGPVSLRWYR